MLKRLLSIFFSASSMGIIAIASLALAIYTAFYYEKRPELRIEILSNTDVVDIKERIGDLDILYKGASLEKTQRKLRVISIRVSNIGGADLTKASFDDESPFGFMVSEGEMLDAPEVSGSEYFIKSLRPKLVSQRGVQLSPVIINMGEFYNLKLLILVGANESPRVTAVGKIASVPLSVLDEINTQPQKKFSDELFGGSLLIQALRILAYSAAGFLCLMIPAIVIPAMTDYKAASEKSKRKKQVDAFKRKVRRKLRPTEHFVLDEYVRDGLPALSGLAWIFKEAKEGKVSRVEDFLENTIGSIESVAMSREDFEHANLYSIDELSEHKIFDISVKLDESAANILESFQEFIRDK